MQILRNFPRGRAQVALFDFDGTLSLIRQGWQEVMISFMVETLLELKTGEDEEELRALVEEFVSRLTGKQTIYQMIRLGEEIQARGGRPEDPLVYKQRYHDRLWKKIEGRVRALSSGQVDPAEWLVPGSYQILERLKEEDLILYLASGTDLQYVRNEARLLGLEPYFGPRIYGALDDYRRFSKGQLIRDMIRETGLAGPELVAFGDGYVEIEETKAVGGIAVGVASDELRREAVDPWKQRRLVEAGADIIVGDFRRHAELAAALLGEEQANALSAL